MAKTPAPHVTTTAGQLRGAWKGGTRKDTSGRVAVFKNIPYAAPPIGSRRWRAPEPAAYWSGVRNATKDGPTAIQRASLFELFIDELITGQGWGTARTQALKTLTTKAPRPKESEDCLHLTVRTPSPGGQAKLPVMVWIHGGDHSDGAGSEPFYAANALPQLGVVTVLINYRLGLMGYFAHPELGAESEHGVSGNYGTLDQIAALKWVQENITAFGGDPDNVTIFGESAGGESVMHMMTSPLARGLFHQAIPQSPANSGQMIHLRRPFLNFDSAEDNSVAFANALGITGSGQLGRLRDRTPDELYALVRAAPRLGDHYPAIDGYVLPESPLAAFANGRQADVPLAIGTNADEGSILRAPLGGAMAEYRHQAVPENALQPELGQAFGDDLDQLLTCYPGLDRGDRDAEIDFLGDHMFGGRAYWYAKHHAAAGRPTWLYHFARTPPSANQTAGAYHAAELAFVHGSNVPILPLTADDKVLAEEMRRYWTQFAKHGNPNGSASVAWPSFNPTSPEWIRFNHTIAAEPVPLVEKYRLLNARTERLVDAMSSIGVSPAPQPGG